MTHEERARAVLAQIQQDRMLRQGSAVQTLAAAFAEVEEEALERAAEEVWGLIALLERNGPHAMAGIGLLRDLVRSLKRGEKP